jgi:hypothetical protein
MSGRAEGAGALCGARTRGGGLCQRGPAAGKRRCRLHGGAPGSGAPKGSRNALKNGLYTREEIAKRKRLDAFIREAWRMIQDSKANKSVRSCSDNCNRLKMIPR